MIIYSDHSFLKYLLVKRGVKPRLIQWVLLLQEFNLKIYNKMGSENLVADLLSRLEQREQGDNTIIPINEEFPNQK